MVAGAAQGFVIGVWSVDRSAPPGGVRFVSRAREVRFIEPVEILCAHALEQVVPCVRRVDAAVADGLHAAGFIAYEAAPAFNPDLTTHAPGPLPLVWFGLFRQRTESGPCCDTAVPFSVGPWTAEVGEADYLDAIRRIREFIAAGDTYQVNYTFPMQAAFEGDALSWFRRLERAQRADYAAFIDAAPFTILSASPELFFRLEGDSLETRPMKGTRPRGRWFEEDRRLAAELAASEKDRAENVMIVDLLRNDMGRISDTGSVHVASLFDVERYETVWQMTSTIRSRTSAPLPEILSALFPSGSVTGAPKVRTMQIIRDLEPAPRGVYCGAVGWYSPGRLAEFNVAIRTVAIDQGAGTARYHVGSGITWGSSAEAEYDECLIKAAVLAEDRPEFDLLESLRFDGEYLLLDEHLARLAASAEYFGFEVDVEAVRAALLDETAAFKDGPLKVRLLAARDGTHRIEAGPAAPSTPVRLGFAAEPVDDRDVFLYHKTTHRAVYERARASRPDCDDVLLWNARGEITETTTANVVLEIDGRLWTPPVAAGLLAGTMRASLLANGAIQERVMTKVDVARAGAVRLINSVRQWVDAVLVA